LEQRKKTVFLFDGYALAYRAYFALIKNPLRNSKGVNTNAVFGVLNTVLRIKERMNPDYMVFLFDRKEPTFRHELYKEYKATREKMPDELRESIPYLRDALGALNIPIIERAGLEADDLLASLAKRAKREGFATIMVTGDKDLFQCIEEDVSILSPARGANIQETLYTIENAHERLGVPPKQVIDFLVKQYRFDS
jgi:DNA polymerase-1